VAEALLGGRTAVVTGARRGVGAAIAEALLRHGARVVLCGRDRAGVEEQVAALHARGLDGAVAFTGDLATEPVRVALTEGAERVTGDCVWADSGFGVRGIGSPGGGHDLDPADLDSVPPHPAAPEDSSASDDEAALTTGRTPA
jgi:NAD(P)-dependent dehydrogenase (short-subunit alcohol dehydrogenase family)